MIALFRINSLVEYRRISWKGKEEIIETGDTSGSRFAFAKVLWRRDENKSDEFNQIQILCAIGSRYERCFCAQEVEKESNTPRGWRCDPIDQNEDQE